MSDNDFIVFTSLSEKKLDKIIYRGLTLLEALEKIKENPKYQYMHEALLNKYTMFE